MAQEGETEKRARGLFLARPTSGKTPLIVTWLPVGATNFAGRMEGGSSSASARRRRRPRRWWQRQGWSIEEKERGIERERERAVLMDGVQRGGGGGGRKTEADTRVLHTPLHLLVNRINQRHHGLSPIPLHLRASTFLNLPPFLHLLLVLPFTLAPSSPPFPPPSPTTTSADSIAIYSQRAPT